MSSRLQSIPSTGWHRAEHELARLTDTLGGPARRRAVLLLAAVLALGSADVGTVGALAPQLESGLHIGNIDVGLLVTVSALAGAMGMLPVGVATDRWRRTALIVGGVALWGAGQLASAASVSFLMLLLVRLALGSLTAVTGPTVASLTGDLFPPEERSRIYGFILTGELLGAGLGLLLAGLVAGWAGWRVAFLVMAVPSVLLAWGIHRLLPEPARGGQSRLEIGADEMIPAEAVADAAAAPDRSESRRRAPTEAATSPEPDTSPEAATSTELATPPEETAPTERTTPTEGARSPDEHVSVAEVVKEQGVRPTAGAVLGRDPMELSWWQAARFVVSVRSNTVMIVASALGYFFLSGLETFALIYLRGHFGLAQGLATLMVLGVGAFAIAGAIAGGRASDNLLRRGRIDGRLVVAGVGYVATALLFAPAAASTVIFLSAPLFLLASLALSSTNPGLDAARLDIMPSLLWGRAESVRSLLRGLLQAFAPLLFGLTSELFGGRSEGFQASAGSGSSHASARQAAGLEETFLVMLVPLLLAGVVVLWGRRWYAGDVAAAEESEERFPPTPEGETSAPRGEDDDGRRTGRERPEQPRERDGPDEAASPPTGREPPAVLSG